MTCLLLLVVKLSLVGLCKADILLSLCCLPGMMADKFGNYSAAFLMSGGVGIIASVIPFLLLCVKRKPEETSGGDLPSRQQDCENEQELSSNTTMGNNAHQRPVSFIISIESSI